MNNFTLILVALSISLGGTVSAQEKSSGGTPWSYSLRVGTVTAPTYLGDDDHQTLVVPDVKITYSNTFSFSLLKGMKYSAWQTKSWSLGPTLKYHFGRDENGSYLMRISGNSTNELNGLSTVDFTLEPGVFFRHRVGSFFTEVEIRQGIGGHQGMVTELKSEFVGGVGLFGLPVLFKIGPQLKFADARYHEAFFAVGNGTFHEQQDTALAAQHSLLSYGVNSKMMIPLTKNISTILYANYSRLGKQASDSDLVQQHGTSNQSSFGIFLNYTF